MFATATSTANPTTLTTLIEQFIHAGLYLKNWSPNTARAIRAPSGAFKLGWGRRQSPKPVT